MCSRSGVRSLIRLWRRYAATVHLPAGSYNNVVVTRDTALLDTSKLEHKFYAPGVGFLGSTGMVNGHNEESKLSSVLKSGG